jgi:signal transduction histidine kinase
LGAASFRLAATYLAIFTLSVVVLGTVVYFSVGHEFARESDERVVAEAASLQNYFLANGLERLADLVRARAGGAGALDYRLEDGAGRLLAGDSPSPRSPEGKVSDGWVQLADLDRDLGSGEEADRERALVTRLDGGAVLVIGEELSGVRGAKRAILVAFAWALAATVVLGAIGGLALGAAFLRRIDAMTTTANGIIAGDLGRRIPDTNVDDDLGRLARTFNRMLDRIASLLEANRQVSNDIAHDLRSPLARVLRRMEAARAHAADLAEYERAIEASISEIHGVLETFGALLRIGQIETGARRAGFRIVDFAAIARDVAEAFQPAAADEGKTLAIELGAALPMLGDRELLTQLAANLIDNAIRHTPAGARIEVSSARTGNCGQFIVADNGPGVPPSERTRIFERFYRVDSARATPGDGLGLSLVAAIAELHGGQVSAVDNAPGLKVAFAIPTLALSAAGDSRLAHDFDERPDPGSTPRGLANLASVSPARPPGSPPASSAPGRAVSRSRS